MGEDQEPVERTIALDVRAASQDVYPGWTVPDGGGNEGEVSQRAIEAQISAAVTGRKPLYFEPWGHGLSDLFANAYRRVTFLIDIGRVLLDFDFETSLSRLLPPGVGDPRERLGRLLEYRDVFESGVIGPDAYIDWALGVLGSEATADEFRHAWRHIFTPNQPMWDCVRRLAAGGHRLLLFSNTNAIHCPWLFDAYPEFALFHGAVLSFETGFIKPQPEIYQFAVDSYGLVADSTLYIDDLAPNIAAGRRFGFHCMLYDLHDHAAFERWLAGFGIGDCGSKIVDRSVC